MPSGDLQAFERIQVIWFVLFRRVMKRETDQERGLRVLLGCLLESPLGTGDPPVAVLNEHANVVRPLVLYAGDERIIGLLLLEFLIGNDELLLMGPRTRAEVHFLRDTTRDHSGRARMRWLRALVMPSSSSCSPWLTLGDWLSDRIAIQRRDGACRVQGQEVRE